MLRIYRADLHIHSCLSPCAELEMTPKRIIGRARERALDIIAITDHNASENISAALSINSPVTIIPGMEITTSEEAHIIALMPDKESISGLRCVVRGSMPVQRSEKMAFEQVIVNEFDEVEGFASEPLINATSMDTLTVIKLIHEYNGIAIAAHVDREVFSILTQLGFIPSYMDFDALEISFRTPYNEAERLLSRYKGFPWITSSDAHHLADIGRTSTDFILKEPTFEEIKMALKSRDGRGIHRDG